jgi:hypothetical protein
VSRNPDGRIGELFLNNHKRGKPTDTIARDFAIALSFVLQHPPRYVISANIHRRHQTHHACSLRTTCTGNVSDDT